MSYDAEGARIQDEIDKQQAWDEAEHVHAAEVARIDREFCREMMAEEPEFCHEARVRYLRGEVALLESDLAALYQRDEARRLQGVDDESREILRLFGGEEDYQRRLKRARGELEARLRKAECGVPDVQVEAARGADLSGYFEQVRGSRVSCPFCTGSKQLTAAIKPGRFTCWRCGLSLDAIAFLRQLRGLDFAGAVRELSGT